MFVPQCLVEAVCVLDCVCVEDTSLVFRAFPCIKALYGRLSSDLSFARVLLPIAQFYLHHGAWSRPPGLIVSQLSDAFLDILTQTFSPHPGEVASVDCEHVWNLVFGRFPAELFNDNFLAYELLRFLQLNLDRLLLRVPQYLHHFPNLLKVESSF